MDIKIIGLSVFQIISLLISIGLLIWIALKFKLNKKQWHLFSITTLFWTSIKLIRTFRKPLATSGLEGSMSNEELLVAVGMIVGAYGFISIFVRLPIGIISDKIKDRKIFIYIASTLLAISSSWVFFDVSFASMLISALMVGIGASIWGLLNVMFSESFRGKDKLIAISIISIAPLLADYIAAPIQDLSLNNESMGMHYLWLFSSIFALLTILVTFRYNSNDLNSKGFNLEVLKKIVKNKKIYIISSIGALVLLIKFANSGTNAVSFAKELGMPDTMKAFFDTMFSLPQLIAGVLVGTLISKKIGPKKTLLVGLILTLIFNLLASMEINYVYLFILYPLNGFGYGLTYNVLLGYALNDYETNERATVMGFYQSILAVGIFFGATLSSVIADTLGSYSIVFLSLGIITIIPIILVLFFVKTEEI